MARSSDLAPLLQRRRQNLSIRQGVVVAWDTDAGTNQVRLGGTLLSDLSTNSGFSPTVGDIVELIRSGSTWFVSGSYSKSSGTSVLVTSVNGQTGDVVLTIPSTAADVGALSTAPEIGWTTVSTTGPVTGTDRARVKRHATGQVELQLSVNVSGLGSGDIIADGLPAWAQPTDGNPISLNPAVNATTSGTVQANITPAGEVKMFADSPGSVSFVRFVQPYTP